MTPRQPPHALHDEVIGLYTRSNWFAAQFEFILHKKALGGTHESHILYLSSGKLR